MPVEESYQEPDPIPPTPPVQEPEPPKAGTPEILKVWLESLLDEPGATMTQGDIDMFYVTATTEENSIMASLYGRWVGGAEGDTDLGVVEAYLQSVIGV